MPARAATAAGAIRALTTESEDAALAAATAAAELVAVDLEGVLSALEGGGTLLTPSCGENKITSSTIDENTDKDSAAAAAAAVTAFPGAALVLQVAATAAIAMGDALTVARVLALVILRRFPSLRRLPGGSALWSDVLVWRGLEAMLATGHRGHAGTTKTAASFGDRNNNDDDNIDDDDDKKDKEGGFGNGDDDPVGWLLSGRPTRWAGERRRLLVTAMATVGLPAHAIAALLVRHTPPPPVAAPNAPTHMCSFPRFFVFFSLFYFCLLYKKQKETIPPMCLYKYSTVYFVYI